MMLSAADAPVPAVTVCTAAELKSALAALRPGPSGSLWFYEWDADPRFGPLAADGTVTPFSSRTNQIYYELVLDPDGNLWGPAYNRGLTSGIVRIAPDGKVLFFEVGNVTGLTQENTQPLYCCLRQIHLHGNHPGIWRRRTNYHKNKNAQTCSQSFI